MKRLIIQLFIALFAFTANAQKLIWNDPVFTYNKGFDECEKHWVIMPRSDTATAYPFGFLYADKETGFVFQQVGVFKVDGHNKYVVDEASLKRFYPKDLIDQYKRLSGSVILWRFALIPAERFNELKITQSEPDWVKPYDTYTDTLEHNYCWGQIYGHVMYHYMAVSYFEKVRQVNPHYKDVERKLAWAYTGSNQYDKAINFLNNCLADSPGNLLFYLSLCDTYEMKGDWQMCLKTCQRGLAYTTVEKSYNKGSLAIQMGNAYSHLNNVNEAEDWWAKGRSYDSNPNRGTP